MGHYYTLLTYARTINPFKFLKDMLPFYLISNVIQDHNFFSYLSALALRALSRLSRGFALRFLCATTRHS